MRINIFLNSMNKCNKVVLTGLSEFIQGVSFYYYYHKYVPTELFTGLSDNSKWHKEKSQ